MRKILITVIIPVILCTPLQAQLFVNDTTSPSLNKIQQPEKPGNFHFGLSLGTGFTKSSSGNFYNTSVTPSMSYSVSQKLSIEAGVSYVNFFNTGNQQSGNTESPFVIPQKTVFLFAGARYKVSDRLTVNSIVYKSQSAYIPVMNPQALALFPDSKGYAIGIQYKLTDHASIGAQFIMNQGSNYFNNPLGGGWGMSPFMNPFSGY